MKVIQAVFENGVFRPTAPVDLPEGYEVTIVTGPDSTPPGPSRHLLRIYELLGQSEDTCDPDLSERHDQHQP